MLSSLSGRLRAAVPLVVLSTAAAGLAGPAQAQVGPPSPVPPSAVAAPDFASEVHGDPWDFSNPEDMLLDDGPTNAVENARIADGLLSFSMSRAGHLSPVWGGYPGALYLGREGGAPANRLDADRYTRFSLHAFSSRTVPAGVMWFSCEGLDPACMGGQSFELKAGWHTYDFALENRGYGLPQAWSGMMTGFRLAVSPSERTDVQLDWMRLYAPSATTPAVPAGAQWDVDDDPSDNTPDRPGWGAVPGTDLGFLPPGSYTVGSAGGPAAPVTLRRPARPVVLDPDLAGGAEYAAADPWDFNGPGDVASTGNTRMLSFGDRLVAENVAAPDINDPHVWLALRSPTIDTERFHRVTVRSGYEGPFNLDDTVGGGKMARVVWRPTNTGESVQQTQDIVTYSGTRSVAFSLKQPNVHETDVDAGAPQPWASAPANAIRWDPNEGRGADRWSLERFALRADDEAGTSFDVRWYDAGYAPGSTVTISRADDRTGRGAQTLATGIAQQPGTNVFRWDSSTTPQGEYWISVAVTGQAGSATSWSTGPVQVVPGLVGQSASPASPLARDLADACPQDRVPEDGFADVPAGGVHEPSVDCIAWWGVTQPAGGYQPGGPVTREQMASFLRRVVERTRGPLPAGPDAFGDDDGAHADSIDALAAVGILGGFADGTYRPREQVTRAQMASFLVRAAEYAGGRELVRTADHFTDDAGTHEVNIDKAAGAGIAGGVAEGRYAPAPGVRRDQMASFLARTLDLLVAGGTGDSPPR